MEQGEYRALGPGWGKRFDEELRELLLKYAPIKGTVTENEDPDSDIDPEAGMEHPVIVTDFLLVAVYEDATGKVQTAHLCPDDYIRYRMLGLIETVSEVI